MKQSELVRWLRTPDPEAAMQLYRHADAVRRANVGEAVHIVGSIEISNHCVRDCAYCGLRSERHTLPRYRMTAPEVISCARKAAKSGCSGLFLQAGDDTDLTGAWVADLIRQIKARTDLEITLSLGERSEANLIEWRQAGADRYLLRFETSDSELFRRIHPLKPGHRSDRPGLLKTLREIGYRIATGVMAGLPGQSYKSLAQDIQLFEKFDLDLLCIGPYLPHPDTPMAAGSLSTPLPEGQQVPSSAEMVYRVLALCRRLYPRLHVITTAALGTLNPVNGRELGLGRGGNMVAANVTPAKYRKLYDVYPDRICLREPAERSVELLRGRIRGIGRRVTIGPGLPSATKFL